MYKVKILILIILIGMISSCKNNNDGYSDEIETSTTPLDTAVKDTAKIINNNDVNSASSKQSTVGTGTGPSASAEDGATYTIESGVQKDSMKLKRDSIKMKKK